MPNASLVLQVALAGTATLSGCSKAHGAAGCTEQPFLVQEEAGDTGLLWLANVLFPTSDITHVLSLEIVRSLNFLQTNYCFIMVVCLL